MAQAFRTFLRARTPAWLLFPVSTWLVFQYRWVLDDAFVYFRYAENFAQTGELVFNRGEYVEAFTSPLWMLLLAFTRLMGLRFWPVIVCVSIACAVLFCALLLRANDAFSPKDTLARVHLPAALLCTNYAVLSHFGSGMETPLVQLCAVAFAYLAVEPSNKLAQVLVAIAPVVRPELVLPFGVAVAWTWWRWRRFPRLLGLLGGGLGVAWLLFRIEYYADLFPNTYYLKVGGNWSRGVDYLLDTFTQYYFHLWLIALLVATLALAIWRRHHAELQERAVVWLGALLVVVHVVRMGGDFVHYRYLAFPVCALLASFGGVAESLLEGFPRARRIAAPFITLTAAALMTAMYPSRQLPAHPLQLGRHNLSTLQALVTFSNDNIEEAMRHRSVVDLDPERWDVPVATTPLPSEYTELLRTGWCAAAYEQMDTYVVHSLGLNSAVLARLPLPADEQAGHKWNLRYYADDLVALWTSRVVRRGDLRAPIRHHPRRGAFREAVQDGRAPTWVWSNLDALEVIEDKTFNRHDPLENIELAVAQPRLTL